MREAVARLGAARPDIVVLAAFEDAIAPLRDAVRALPGDPVIVGNGAWTMRPTTFGQPADLDGVYAVDTPSPREQSESALAPAGRSQLAEWTARHGLRSGEHLPVDADLAFAASAVFFELVLARAPSPSASDLRATAATVDVPRGGTLLGYGVRFDDRGDNQRTYSVVVRWDKHVKRIVHPPELASAGLG